MTARDRPRQVHLRGLMAVAISLAAMLIALAALAGGAPAVASPPASAAYAYDAPVPLLAAGGVPSSTAMTPAANLAVTDSARTIVSSALRGSTRIPSLGLVAAEAGGAGAELASAPNRIYSARVLMRAAEEPGPYRNFSLSFDEEIFGGSRTEIPDYFNQPRAGLSNNSVQYRLSGNINGQDGTYEIFTRPSVSGRNEVITHRFFNPGP